MTALVEAKWTTRRTASGIAFETLDADVGTSAPWIIFVHGVGLRRQIWRPWMQRLGHFARCAALDIPGYGESPLQGGSRTLDSWVGYIEDVRQDLGAERVSLVGESLGGTSSIAYSLEHPEKLSSLVLCSTGFQGSRIPEVERWRQIFESLGPAGWSEYMNERRFNPGDDAWAKKEAADAQVLCDPETVIGDGEMLLRVDLSAPIGSLVSPVLLLQPGSSPFISRAHAFELEAAIPDVECVLIGKSRHGIALAYAAECSAIAAAFLERHAGSGHRQGESTNDH